MTKDKPPHQPPAIRATTEPLSSARAPVSFETSDEAGTAFGNTVIRLLAVKTRPLLPLSPLSARLQSINNPSNPELDDVLSVVEADPCAAIEVVSAANLGADAENVCLRQAIESLGAGETLVQLKHYATSSGEAWPGLNSHKLRRFWSSTLFAAASARELAQRTKHAHPEHVFLMALLHNTGEPLTLSLLERELHREWAVLAPNAASLAAYQHERLGQVYLQSRHIPKAICTFAGDHHQAIDSAVHALVFLGDAAALNYGYSYLRRKVDKRLLREALHRVDLPALNQNQLAANIAPFLNKALTVAR